MEDENLILDSDSYKDSHWKMLPPEADYMYSYMESRGGEFSGLVMAGLLPILQSMSKPITKEHLDEAEEITVPHLNSYTAFNREGWKYIIDKYGGYIPLEIRAIPEGTIVPTGNIMLDVSNNDAKLPWLVGHFETKIMRIWYSLLTATLCHDIKQSILPYLHKNGTPEDIDFKLHDFGARSGTSSESVCIAGAAHLLSFKGTDNKLALRYIRKTYGPSDIIAGFSVAAAEHSTVTAWGKDLEVAAYQNILDSFPDGVVSIVSDSYDLYNACHHIFGDILRDRIIKRNGVVVIRPDSGDPTSTMLTVLQILDNRFVMHKNEKDYKVLPPYIRTLQGDGMNRNSIKRMLSALDSAGYSADNIATFGMGTKLHMYGDRDTQRMKFAASAVHERGAWHDIYKDPVTDPGKRSKRGRLALVPDGKGSYKTIQYHTTLPPKENILKTVFYNGQILERPTFPEIRTCLSIAKNSLI